MGEEIEMPTVDYQASYLAASAELREARWRAERLEAEIIASPLHLWHADDENEYGWGIGADHYSWGLREFPQLRELLLAAGGDKVVQSSALAASPQPAEAAEAGGEVES